MASAGNALPSQAGQAAIIVLQAGVCQAKAHAMHAACKSKREHGAHASLSSICTSAQPLRSTVHARA